MTDFAAALDARLARLAEAHGATCFWLRDDDARAPSAALDRLIGLTGDAGVPLALAVIPEGSTDALAARLADAAHACVLQHGFAHANHAPAGEKKAELGDHRAVELVHADLRLGTTRLAAFPRSLPVLVPPWNRIGHRVAHGLSELGFAGLSLYGERERNPSAPGLRQFNTHLDLIDWRNGRRFHGPERMLALLAGQLDRLLAGESEPREATGILTHHLVHDAQTFTFLSSLLEYLGRRSDCRFISASKLLACSSETV